MAGTPRTFRLAPRLIRARSADPDPILRWMMWMPGGIHEITATRAGAPVTVRVQVDRSTAAVAQRSLRHYVAAGRQRPFFDFDHENRSASGHPEEFAWREEPEPGVYVLVRLTKPGADAIEGRSYRAFSPSFYADDQDPAHVIGAPLNMGGLVNDPAFRSIQPHFAKSANLSHPKSMNNQTKLLALLSAINALQQDRAALAAKGGGDNAEAIKAKDATITAKLSEATSLQATIDAETAEGGPVTLHVMDAKASIEAKDAEITLLKTQLEGTQSALDARNRAQAQAAVDAAVARGAIRPQDKDTQTKWLQTLQRDPSMIDLFSAMPGSQVLAGRVITNASSSGDVSVTSEDTRRVVNAYHAAATAAERSAIWASDLRARVERRDELVIQAANTLGGVTGNLVVQRALELLKLQFPMLGMVSSDFSSDNAAYGQTVKTRIRSVPSTTDYSTSTGYADSGVTTTDVDVVIDAHKAVQITFNANELAGTRRLLFDEQTEGMHYALGKVLVDALYGVITVANFSNQTVKALGTFGRGALTSAGKSLGARGVPVAGRYMLLNGDYYEQLAQDSSIVQLAAYQKSEVITENRLPRVAGFQPWEAHNLPTAENLVGFGATPSALAIATRVPNDYTLALGSAAAGSGLISTITNPDTGVSVMLAQFVNHTLGASYLRIALMYGVAKGQTDAGQRLVSAAP